MNSRFSDLLTTVETYGAYDVVTNLNVFAVHTSDKPDETGDYKIVALNAIKVGANTNIYCKGWQSSNNFEFWIYNMDSTVKNVTIYFTWLMMRKVKA